MSEIKKKIFPVEKIGDEMVIIGDLESELKPKFLAKNPKNNDLFLLLGDDGHYSLLKGTEREGLRYCEPKRVLMMEDCFLIIFVQNGMTGSISDPDSPELQKPSYNDLYGGKRPISLELEKFKMVA